MAFCGICSLFYDCKLNVYSSSLDSVSLSISRVLVLLVGLHVQRVVILYVYMCVHVCFVCVCACVFCVCVHLCRVCV